MVAFNVRAEAEARTYLRNNDNSNTNDNGEKQIPCGDDNKKNKATATAYLRPGLERRHSSRAGSYTVFAAASSIARLPSLMRLKWY